MKTNSGLFGLLGVFVLLVAFIYGFVTGFEELAGFPLLLLTAGLGFMLWFYLRLTAKHSEVMDSDNPEGEIHQQAGNYGEFAPWSWWPLGLGFSSAFVFFGMAYDWWVVFIGAIPAIFFVTGWVLEYNRKRYAH
ncbi:MULTISPECIES: cytochrome c oxidase subunit 4 [Nesterenkonia]|uniref:Cytochrome c oxidase polypeptide 4 n=1 Tax=Nesterenkonia xinjiangensis TaxID=225327 RepID=A0A7Z0GNX1_9MICC|nr:MULTISPECIES: cytochrome c oxidase subunit 4 [Nesterenkonia]MDZ5077945.1 cytochrome c oxidase subunit 4 [Nesterenkonia sp. HG001]NYJ79451.1 Zn-dependent protease with chaperone function [Nesterenkonia xinjiangensis]